MLIWCLQKTNPSFLDKNFKLLKTRNKAQAEYLNKKTNFFQPSKSIESLLKKGHNRGKPHLS